MTNKGIEQKIYEVLLELNSQVSYSPFYSS